MPPKPAAQFQIPELRTLPDPGSLSPSTPFEGEHQLLASISGVPLRLNLIRQVHLACIAILDELNQSLQVLDGDARGHLANLPNRKTLINRHFSIANRMVELVSMPWFPSHGPAYTGILDAHEQLWEIVEGLGGSEIPDDNISKLRQGFFAALHKAYKNAEARIQAMISGAKDALTNRIAWQLTPGVLRERGQVDEPFDLWLIPRTCLHR